METRITKVKLLVALLMIAGIQAFGQAKSPDRVGVENALSVATSAFTYGGWVYNSQYWDDILFPFSQARQGATSKPDYDFTDNGLLFPNNDTTEIIYLVCQLPHSYKEGSNIFPHVHWRRTASGASGIPTWGMAYKWTNIGDVEPSSWTVVYADTTSIAYTSGNQHTLSGFGEITGTGKKISSILLVKLYRKDSDVTGDVLGYQFDIHYQKDAIGSRQQTIK